MIPGFFFFLFLSSKHIDESLICNQVDDLPSGSRISHPSTAVGGFISSSFIFSLFIFICNF